MDWIRYADDIVLIFDKVGSLQCGLILLDKILTRFQLSIIKCFQNKMNILPSYQAEAENLFKID